MPMLKLTAETGLVMERAGGVHVGLVVGARLDAHPAQCLQVLARLVKFPFCLRFFVGFVRDHHEQAVGADVASGLPRRTQRGARRTVRTPSAC